MHYSKRKSSHLFCESLALLIANSPRESLLSITLTLQRKITDPKVANNHFRSLAKQLRLYFSDYVRVVEPQKSGRIHYHLVAVDRQKRDIYTGYDYKTGKSTNKALHTLQRKFRATIKGYPVFGIVQVQPLASVKGTMKYLVDKLVSKRWKGWEGVRLWAPTKDIGVDWSKSIAGKEFKRMDATLIADLRHNHKMTPKEILILNSDPRKWAYWKLILMYRLRREKEVMKKNVKFKEEQFKHGKAVSRQRAQEREDYPRLKIRHLSARMTGR